MEDGDYEQGASPFYLVFHRGYSLSMEWEVEYTDEFGDWWMDLTAEEQEDARVRQTFAGRRP
jgi:hypothetical protein